MPTEFFLRSIAGVVVATAVCVGQTPQKPQSTEDVSAASHAIEIAERGQCAEALPSLKKAVSKLDHNREVKRKAGLEGVRCAMTLGRPESATEFLQILGHDFPKDPEVLYVLVHGYSDLSTRAAQRLAQTAPDSSQAHLLNAETYEMQGKWDDAAQEYETILKQNPKLPGIHFRLGRLLLSKPNPPPDVVAQARKEFEAELKIDPSNAGAEYVLGELARQEQNWDEAAQRFSRAAKLDSGFGDAYLGWGESLLNTKRFSEAISPLEIAAQLEPGNPATHYNLAVAYSRSGRKDDAAREFAIHRQLTQKSPNDQTEPAATTPNPNP